MPPVVPLQRGTGAVRKAADRRYGRSSAYRPGACLDESASANMLTPHRLSARAFLRQRRVEAVCRENLSERKGVGLEERLRARELRRRLMERYRSGAFG